MTDTGETVAIVDPRTGVAFKPEEVQNNLLVEIFVELERREKQLQEWRRLAEDELVRRVEGGQFVLGNLLVDVERNRSRIWDGPQLEATLDDLGKRGLVTLRQIDGVVKRTYSVDGKKAANLLNDLDGEALQMVRDCFMWKRGRPRVKVIPKNQIEEAT